jgi:hypothetical protein
MTNPITTSSTDRDLRQDVAEVLVRYATGIDRRDSELFRSRGLSRLPASPARRRGGGACRPNVPGCPGR